MKFVLSLIILMIAVVISIWFYFILRPNNESSRSVYDALISFFVFVLIVGSLLSIVVNVVSFIDIMDAPVFVCKNEIVRLEDGWKRRGLYLVKGNKAYNILSCNKLNEGRK